MADKQTIKAYDSNVDTYKKMVSKLPDLETLQAFIAELPQGALVLDWGSGPGYLANRMRQAGLKPVCSDASAEMVAAAQQDFGLEARQEPFSALQAVSLYQGIWANFSLLHAERADFPQHIAAAATALVPSGVFYLALKSGSGDARDDLGRLYAYYTQAELEDITRTYGLQVIRIFTGRSAGMSGKPENWVGLLCRKQPKL
ncbi:MAG: class I SAM-dependent methyltransferase [Candidatus Puniceispirillaceae bacterium]